MTTTTHAAIHLQTFKKSRVEYGAGLLEGKTLTYELASFMGAGQMKGTAIRAADVLEFLQVCNSAVLSEISDKWETERASMNMEAK